MPNYTDEEYVEALRQLRRDLDQILPQQSAEQLGKQLDNLLSQADDPHRLPASVDFSLDAIRDHPPAPDHLEDLLRRLAGIKSAHRLRLLTTPAGPPVPIPPGTRVCCPVDPTHLIARLRRKGQRCPQHNARLVPCDLISQPGGPD
jgi:hypothetical protein